MGNRFKNLSVEQNVINHRFAPVVMGRLNSQLPGGQHYSIHAACAIQTG